MSLKYSRRVHFAKIKNFLHWCIVCQIVTSDTLTILGVGRSDVYWKAVCHFSLFSSGFSRNSREFWSDGSTRRVWGEWLPRDQRGTGTTRIYGKTNSHFLMAISVRISFSGWSTGTLNDINYRRWIAFFCDRNSEKKSVFKYQLLYIEILIIWFYLLIGFFNDVYWENKLFICWFRAQGLLRINAAMWFIFSSGRSWTTGTDWCDGRKGKIYYLPLTELSPFY